MPCVLTFKSGIFQLGGSNCNPTTQLYTRVNFKDQKQMFMKPGIIYVRK